MDDETLILTVGGTPRPLEVAIEQIKPKFVYFIHSKETLKTVEEILENVSFDLEYSLVKIKLYWRNQANGCRSDAGF